MNVEYIQGNHKSSTTQQRMTKDTRFFVKRRQKYGVIKSSVLLCTKKTTCWSQQSHAPTYNLQRYKKTKSANNCNPTEPLQSEFNYVIAPRMLPAIAIRFQFVCSVSLPRFFSAPRTFDCRAKRDHFPFFHESAVSNRSAARPPRESEIIGGQSEITACKVHLLMNNFLSYTG